MTKIFIDGSAGTTGLRIADRLADRQDITLVKLPEALRKDPAARRDAICGADIAFLCLPDDAAREAVARMLKSFSEDGLVELKRGAITLRDKNRLNRLK